MEKDLEKNEEEKKEKKSRRTSKVTSEKKETTKKSKTVDEEVTPKKKVKGVEELRKDILEEIEQLVGEDELKKKRKTKVNEKLYDKDNDKKESEKEEKNKVENKKEEKNKDIKVELKKMIVKEDKKDIAINQEKMERIEEEIKKQTTISDEKKNKINKVIFHNISIATIVILYFIFLILGYQSLQLDKFMIDLQVFSGVTLGIAIIIFEKAYKNDSSEYAIHGIETLFLAIVTLISIYVLSKYEEKFVAIIAFVCYMFAIYYVGKSIVIYLKMRQKALKRTNDIRKIAKK